jgi:hypothetical protein
MTRIMSVSLLLFIVAIVAPVLLFADTAMQWSLRFILDEGRDYPRTQAQGADEAAAEGAPASQTAQAA